MIRAFLRLVALGVIVGLGVAAAVLGVGIAIARPW